MYVSHLASQRLSFQAVRAEIPALLGAYGSIPFRSTCHCALVACRGQDYWVSYPKPVAEDRFDGEFWDYNEDMQLLSALRSPSFDPVGNLSKLEDDVYLVLRASGLHDLWPDYQPPAPLGPDDTGPCKFSDVDIATMFPHMSSVKGQSNKEILAALAARCRLPSARVVVAVAFEDTLAKRCFFPRPLHFAVIHNSAPAVQMILSYVNQQHPMYLKETLQDPFDSNFGECSPLLLAILFADSEISAVLKRFGSKLNHMDYQIVSNLQCWGLFGGICKRMIELGLAAVMFFLRQTILKENVCRISWTDHLWSLRAKTSLNAQQFLEPYEERDRCNQQNEERERQRNQANLS